MENKIEENIFLFRMKYCGENNISPSHKVLVTEDRAPEVHRRYQVEPVSRPCTAHSTSALSMRENFKQSCVLYCSNGWVSIINNISHC